MDQYWDIAHELYVDIRNLIDQPVAGKPHDAEHKPECRRKEAAPEGYEQRVEQSNHPGTQVGRLIGVFEEG